jgi:hypothetical protein
MFGTLHIEKAREHAFGLKERQQYNTLFSMLVTPLVESFNSLNLPLVPRVKNTLQKH